MNDGGAKVLALAWLGAGFVGAMVIERKRGIRYNMRDRRIRLRVMLFVALGPIALLYALGVER